MQLPRLARASLMGAILSVVAACHGDGAPRLQGKWRGVRAEGVTPETVAAANAFATATEIDVKGDAITVITPKDKQSGRYKVVLTETDAAGTSTTQVFTGQTMLRNGSRTARAVHFVTVH